MVKKESGKWYVYSETGKKLSKGYDTKAKAEDRLKEIEAFKHMNNIRVNLLNAVNADSISVERFKENGDDYVMVKNAVWAMNDIVLNGGLYPHSELESSYANMEGKLMPYGHPQVNGKYIAISNQTTNASADALAKHYIGAHSVNIRKSGDTYLKDIKINTRIAGAHPGGKKVLAWINKAEKYLNNESKEKPSPLHLSTGLNLVKHELQGNSNGKEYSWVATNMQWDHDAFVENGAGGDKISLSVNADGEECSVLTCNLNDAMDFTTNDKGFWKKAFARIMNKEMSLEDKLDDVRQALKDKYQTQDSYPWPVAVYDNYLIFEIDGEYRKIAYSRDLRDNIVLAEDYIVVEREVDYKPVATKEDNSVMNKFVESLNAAGIKTDGLTDDQIFDAYNAMKDKEVDKKTDTSEDDPEKDKKKKDKAQNSEMPSWAAALNARLDSIETAVNASANAEKAKKVDAIVAKNSSMSKEDLMASPDSVVNSLYSQVKPFGMVNGQTQFNSSEDEDLIGDINSLMGDDK